MLGNTSLGEFLSCSFYTDQADLKKLKFIYSALNNYVLRTGLKLEHLRILEVACGKGGITLPLASLGCSVTAFDVDQAAVSFLKKQAKNSFLPNLKIHLANAYDFDDGCHYHVVIASEVFEHVLYPELMLANIKNLMEQSSLLIATIPNGFGPYELKNRIDIRTYLSRWNLLRRFMGKPPYVYASGPDHCQFYTKRRFLGMILSSEFVLLGSANSDSIMAISRYLRANSLLGRLDIKLAELLPDWLASGWYFEFELIKR
jgi:SAM-dependent methyltransferase